MFYIVCWYWSEMIPSSLMARSVPANKGTHISHRVLSGSILTLVLFSGHCEVHIDAARL
jgi:hypothetical protein